MRATSIAWTGTAMYVVAADVWLIRHGQPTMSALARSRPVLTGSVAALLSAHLVRAWRYDPINLAGKLLQ